MPATPDAPRSPITPTLWTGAYRHGWQGLLDPQAFCHPGKFARGLIHRIYRHLLDQRYIQVGATCLDPFGGVALGALDAMGFGLRWIGVELEDNFRRLGQANLDRWQQRYGLSGGTILQGDSRELRRVLAGAQAGCVVGSPPFHASTGGGGGNQIHCLQNITYTPAKHSAATIGALRHGRLADGTYGSSPGQLGTLPPGSIEAVIGSPPFCQSDGRKGGSDVYVDNQLRRGRNPDSAHMRAHDTQDPYGTSPGQLGALPPGSIEAVLSPAALVSSPPYSGAGQVLGTHNGIDYSKTGTGQRLTPGRGMYPYGRSEGQLGSMPTAVVSSPPYAEGLSKEHTYSDHTKRDKDSHRRIMTEKGIVDPFYGTTEGQLNNMPTTFWEAAAQIMAEVSALLPPGGIAAWVVKPYVKDKAIVPFDRQWLALCQAHGFTLLEEIHASLIEESGVQEGLFGEATIVQTARKSFFRRLAERKGSPAIDAEVVLILRKEASA